MDTETNPLDLLPPHPFAQVDEVAVVFRTTPRTIRDWIAAGRLRAIRVGGRLLIPRDAVRQFIETAPEGAR